MHFEFATTARIIFGSGKFSMIGGLAKDLGSRALIITGTPQVITSQLADMLVAESVISSTIRISHEPTIDDLQQFIEIAKQAAPDFIIGIGGGTALDASKAIASLLKNPGDVLEYLEVIGLGKPILNPSLPLIAIPTTSGTGSEVTRNAVVESMQHHLKVSLRSAYLLPRIALIDPELTLSLPQSITAYTGMDALTQLIEPYTCNTPNPIVDVICLEGIRRVARSFYQAYDHGDDQNAREDMSLAALLGGIALANARLGAVHGFAGPIGGEISAHHGAICASLLANVMSANKLAMRSRQPDHPALERYRIVAQILCNDPSASADAGIDWIRAFCSHAAIASLAKLGLREDQLPTVIDRSLYASSMKGNPITLSEEELRNILKLSL